MENKVTTQNHALDMTSLASGFTVQVSSALLLHTVTKYFAATLTLFYCHKIMSKNSQEIGRNC